MKISVLWGVMGVISLAGGAMAQQDPLVVTTPPAPASAPAAAPPAAELPTIEEIKDMVVKAVGGRENVDGIKTLRVTFSVSQFGLSSTYTTCWSREGGRWFRLDTGTSWMEMGSDGGQAWIKHNDSEKYILANMGQDQRLQEVPTMHMHMVDLATRPEGELKSLKVVERATFEQTECYRIKFEKNNGVSSGFLYVGLESGLPVGYEQEDIAPAGGSARSITVFSDWKEVEGVKFFHTIKLRGAGGGVPAEVKVQAIEVNAVEPEFFVLPEEVVELVEAEKQRVKEIEAILAEEVLLSSLSEGAQRQATGMVGDMKTLGDDNLASGLYTLERSFMQLPDEEQRRIVRYAIQEIRRELAARKKK